MILHSDTGVSVVSGTYERNGRKIWRNDYGRKKNFDTTVRSAGSGRFGAIQNSRRGQADPPLCQGTGGRSSPSGTYFDGAVVSSDLLLCKLTAN